jgi:hypothetical protein
MKTMFALMLIFGIVLAAQAGRGRPLQPRAAQ